MVFDVSYDSNDISHVFHTYQSELLHFYALKMTSLAFIDSIDVSLGEETDTKAQLPVCLISVEFSTSAATCYWTCNLVGCKQQQGKVWFSCRYMEPWMYGIGDVDASNPLRPSRMGMPAWFNYNLTVTSELSCSMTTLFWTTEQIISLQISW